MIVSLILLLDTTGQDKTAIITSTSSNNSDIDRQRLHDITSYEYGDFSIRFHQRCSVYTKSFFVVLSVEVNYACGCAIFGMHLKFSTMHCRKYNFVLIDVEVRILLTFLASMKAKVHNVHVCLYQKFVSVFLCIHVKS